MFSQNLFWPLCLHKQTSPVLLWRWRETKSLGALVPSGGGLVSHFRATLQSYAL